MTGGGGLSRWLKWFRVEAPPPVPPSAVGARRVVVVDDVFCGFCPGPSCSFSAPSRPPGPLARRPPHSRSPPAFLLPASPPGPRASFPARASRRRRVALWCPARGSRPAQPRTVGRECVISENGLETPRTQAVRSPAPPAQGTVRGVSGMGSPVSSGGAPGPLAGSPGAQGTGRGAACRLGVGDARPVTLPS